MEFVFVFENSDKSKVERNAKFEQNLIIDVCPQYASPSSPRFGREVRVNSPLATTTTAVLEAAHTL